MSPSSADDVAELAREVLRIEARAVEQLIPRIGEEFTRAVEMIHRCNGRVVLAGMGKSGLVARKIAATLSSTGTPAIFLQPAEAVHGDLGMVAEGDIVVALSHSGETGEILRLLETMRPAG